MPVIGIVLISGVRFWADTYKADTMLPWCHIVAVDGLAFPTVQAKLHRYMQAHVDNEDPFRGRFPLLPMTAFGFCRNVTYQCQLIPLFLNIRMVVRSLEMGAKKRLRPR